MTANNITCFFNFVYAAGSCIFCKGSRILRQSAATAKKTICSCGHTQKSFYDRTTSSSKGLGPWRYSRLYGVRISLGVVQEMDPEMNQNT